MSTTTRRPPSSRSSRSSLPRTRTSVPSQSSTPSTSTSVPTSVSSVRDCSRHCAKVDSIDRCRASSLSAYQADSKGSFPQTLSSSATIWLSVMPGSATRACTNEPIAERTSRPSLPPCRSSSQRRGQSASVCSVDGDSRTTWSSPNHSVSSVLGEVMPYHCLGSAPDTPAAARRANCTAAQARTLSEASLCGAQITARSLPTSGAGANTGGACTGSAVYVSLSVANCASSAKNGDGSI